MTAAARLAQQAITIGRPDASLPILVANGRSDIAIRAGAVVEIDGRPYAFETETAIALGELVAGRDYGISIGPDGTPRAAIVDADPLQAGCFAGFHYAPGGNATGKDGGDDMPAINPFSLWDAGFRPACDPRGMTLVEVPGVRRVWVDIYLLGIDHARDGTSRYGVTIADGRDRPKRADGEGRYSKLDYATAVEIYASHGKRLLGAEEFFSAAYGVRERSSRDEEPETTGEMKDGAERFVSRHGLFDATGTMWQWGTDGHPDDPRPSLFGGSWIYGGCAGSRCASLDYWAGHSHGLIGCRGACDHL